MTSAVIRAEQDRWAPESQTVGSEELLECQEGREMCDLGGCWQRGEERAFQALRKRLELAEALYANDI